MQWELKHIIANIENLEKHLIKLPIEILERKNTEWNGLITQKKEREIKHDKKEHELSQLSHELKES